MVEPARLRPWKALQMQWKVASLGLCLLVYEAWKILGLEKLFSILREPCRRSRFLDNERTAQKISFHVPRFMEAPAPAYDSFGMRRRITEQGCGLDLELVANIA